MKTYIEFDDSKYKYKRDKIKEKQQNIRSGRNRRMSPPSSRNHITIFIFYINNIFFSLLAPQTLFTILRI